MAANPSKRLLHHTIRCLSSSAAAAAKRSSLLHHSISPSTSTPLSNGGSLLSRLLSRNYTSIPNPSRPIRPSRVPIPTPAASKTLAGGLLPLPPRFPAARFFSTTKGFRSVKLDGGGAARSAARKPLDAAAAAAARYRGAVGMQMEAFWKRNYLVLVGAGAVVVCVALWRIMFGIASTFVGLSEGMAKYGFLAMAAAMVTFAGMYVRSRFTINPDKIYRIAMRKLNTSAGILEVMGAPLTGTEVRAYVMSGGGPKLRDFKMKFGGKRCFLIFPIRGSERRGLVSVEVKKKKGQYDIKLLAVDIPMATGPDQRLYLIGDEQEYNVGGGLISELRDPIVKAMAAEKEFEDLDQKEEEEDELRELEEAERKQREDQERELEEETKQRELESLQKESSRK